MKKVIWDSMLDADLNARYWSYLSRRYYLQDKYSKIFLAAMSSGTVASWQFWAAVPIVWKGLSALSALTAIALPIINWSKMIENMVRLKQQWTEIKNEYEIIWISYRNKNKTDADIEKEILRVKKKEVETSKEEYNLPNIEKLLYKCRDEVLKSRGLN
jgi:hypothetical protein